MKLNRLLEITTILLNKRTVTASELAERFGVSVRTIYRDLDVLSTSGVPVYTTQGQGGGISIMEEYSLHKAILSESDRNNILFALNTLQATRFPEAERILQKLGGIFQSKIPDWIAIDFSSWGSNPNAYNKFLDIKSAILQSKVIEMEYINAKNEKTKRKMEPCRLIFKSHSWYLWGYCLKAEDYRTFRISRIKKVVVTDEDFDRKAVHKNKGTVYLEEKPYIHCVLQFTEEALHRLYDDYDDDMIMKNKDGTYTVTVDYPEDEWLYGYIMSFGTFVKVLEPEHIKGIIKERSRKVIKMYE